MGAHWWCAGNSHLLSCVTRSVELPPPDWSFLFAFVLDWFCCLPAQSERELEWASSLVAICLLRYNPRSLASRTQDQTLFSFDIVD